MPFKVVVVAAAVAAAAAVANIAATAAAVGDGTKQGIRSFHVSQLEVTITHEPYRT